MLRGVWDKKVVHLCIPFKVLRFSNRGKSRKNIYIFELNLFVCPILRNNIRLQKCKHEQNIWVNLARIWYRRVQRIHKEEVFEISGICKKQRRN